MTCHEIVLLIARKVVAEKKDNHFTVSEIKTQLQNQGFSLNHKTIETHVRSRCCVNAPAHHETTYNYFERVGRGVYKICDDYI